MFLLEFFRDTLDGILYYLYFIVCVFVFFYVLGIVADDKRVIIEKKLKEKKQYDIESGKEAAIAAMETKQVLSVDDQSNVQYQGVQGAGINSQVPDPNKKEEVPSVMVLNSNSLSQPQQPQGQMPQTVNQVGLVQQQKTIVQPLVQPIAQQPQVQFGQMRQVGQVVQPGVQQAQPQGSAVQQPNKVAVEPLIINSH